MAKMREGQCSKTRNGMEFCKIGGRVRFTGKASGARKTRSRKRSVAGVGSMSAVDSLMGLGDPVGVSFGDLSAVLSGAKKCLTIIKPNGVQTVCRTTGTGAKTRRRKTTRKR